MRRGFCRIFETIELLLVTACDEVLLKTAAGGQVSMNSAADRTRPLVVAT
jgi:hypothetical protein